MDDSERELCSRADLVLASSRDLAQRCMRYSNNVHYVPHGVDHAHFSQAVMPGPIPHDLQHIPEPRIGFFGLLHEWVDLELIARLADILPYSFVLIGSACEDLSPLLRRKNVFHLGRRPYRELPNYSRGFQAAIVPFHVTELTNSVNPIKLREYAAAGLPVVSADLPEVRSSGDLARCARTVDEWVDALREAVSIGAVFERRRRQSQRVAGEDWSYVCARIADLVHQHG